MKYIGWILLMGFGLCGGLANAGPGVGACPAANLATVCMFVTEPTQTQGGTTFSSGGVTYLSTQFNLSVNGAASVADIAPASSPVGGGVVNYTIATTTCQKNTYAVTAQGLDSVNPLLGPATATVSVTKDRTGDSNCTVPTVPTAPGIQ